MFVLRTTSILAALLFCLPTSISDAAEEVVPRGSLWRYRKGTEPPPPGWASRDLDDGAWEEGPAGIGYSDRDDATVLGDMAGGYLTVYARRQFEIADPSQVKSLVLRILYDDGFAAYLNGVEVVRRHLGDPGSPLGFDTASEDSHEAETVEVFDLTPHLALLAAGPNVLAVEGHNDRLSSPDFSLHPWLTANGPRPGGPEGFVLETAASGFKNPVDCAFLPDGRLLVAEKRGLLWLVKDGAVLPAPALDLTEEVNNSGDRGLLGVAPDDNFASNGWIHLLYVVDPVSGSPEEPGTMAAVGRLTRYTLAGDTVDPTSRRVLLGETASDGFILCHESHAVGTVRGLPDGSLLVGSGDGAHYDFIDAGQDVTPADEGCAALFGSARDTGSFRAADLDALAGKILRLDPATGLGLPDNPHFDGDAASARSKVWISGARNPFRFTVLTEGPLAGAVLLGDVGREIWEEIDLARGGEDFGWPCREGPDPQEEYATHPVAGPLCESFAGRKTADPWIAWKHESPAPGSELFGECVAGIVQYTGTSYPEQFRGKVFFQDFNRGWIKMTSPGADGAPGPIEDFANDLERPVDLELDPGTGDLVIVSLQGGAIQRLRYAPGNRPPSLRVAARPPAGLPPLEVHFTAEGTLDPDGDPFTVMWDFGDGSPAVEAPQAVHSYETRGVFQASARARDSGGAESVETLTINTTSAPPSVSITSPPDEARFYGGETLKLQAAATDLEDGEDLETAWTVSLRHEDHEHPDWFTSTERTPIFVPMSHGDGTERFEYEIRVVVTDSAGLGASAAIHLVPGELIRGDADLDGTINLTDAIQTLLYLFSGRTLDCVLALDTDGNGTVNLSDPIVVLNHLFLGGVPPVQPFPECGIALNVEALPCEGDCR